MSDSRRSSRAKKNVKYSGFEAEEDSDDDFARSIPPPSKRSKLDKKDKSSKVDKIKPKGVKTECKEMKTEAPTESPNGSGRGPRKERVSLDEKLFDREMQLALDLSMQESQDSQTSQPTTNKQTAGRRKDTEAQIHVADETAPTNRSFDHTSSDDKENMAVRPAKPTISSQPSDEIILLETLDEEEAAGGRRKRKAAKAAVAKQREMASEESDGEEDREEDFQADSGDDGSSDDYGADDVNSDYEEFTSSKKRTKSAGKSKGNSPRSSARGKKTEAKGRAKTSSGGKKSKPAPKVAKITNSMPKASPPVTPLAGRPQAMVPSRGFTPPAVTGVKNSQHTNPRAMLSPAVVRKPVWSSPPISSESNPLGGVKLVSPGQPIRLGLSRNVRIRPLHPNAKAH